MTTVKGILIGCHGWLNFVSFSLLYRIIVRSMHARRAYEGRHRLVARRFEGRSCRVLNSADWRAAHRTRGVTNARPCQWVPSFAVPFLAVLPRRQQTHLHMCCKLSLGLGDYSVPLENEGRAKISQTECSVDMKALINLVGTRSRIELIKAALPATVYYDYRRRS